VRIIGKEDLDRIREEQYEEALFFIDLCTLSYYVDGGVVHDYFRFFESLGYVDTVLGRADFVYVERPSIGYIDRHYELRFPNGLTLKYYFGLTSLLAFEVVRLTGIPVDFRCHKGDPVASFEMYWVGEEAYLSADVYDRGHRGFIDPERDSTWLDIEVGTGTNVRVSVEFFSTVRWLRIILITEPSLFGDNPVVREYHEFFDKRYRLPEERKEEMLRKVVGSVLAQFDSLVRSDGYREAKGNVLLIADSA